LGPGTEDAHTARIQRTVKSAPSGVRGLVASLELLECGRIVIVG
jgi:hypothetical protein